VSAVRAALERVLAGEVLAPAQMRAAMEEVLAGGAPPPLLAGFAVALRMRGEATEEIAEAARVLRAACDAVDLGEGTILDTCGTGGDGANTFNISTASAIVVAAAGVRVAKHGNRAVSSRAGSADVLEALGVTLEQSADQARECVREVGITFLYAPAHHGALKHAAAARRALGVRTLFNLLGPLANPANATHQLVGVYDGARIAQMAEVLGALGVERAWVVHGAGGLDEISPSGETQVAVWDGAKVETRIVRPRDFGLDAVPMEALAGGDAEVNANIVRSVLAGQPGAPRTAVLLNAGAALCVAGVADGPAEGARKAAEAIDSGAAEALLARWASR